MRTAKKTRWRVQGRPEEKCQDHVAVVRRRRGGGHTGRIPWELVLQLAEVNEGDSQCWHLNVGLSDKAANKLRDGG